MTDRLTGKQARFVAEYIICMNATEAARRAGYAGDDNALAAAGSRLLRNVKVLTCLDEQLKQYAMPANEVLIHLTDIARGDIADALDSMGGVDATEAVRRGKSHLIKRVRTKTTLIAGRGDEETEIHETEIELYDRLKALDLLAKYHDLTNRLHSEVTVKDWRTQAIEDIRAGVLSYGALATAFADESLAAELFREAGVPVS